MQRAHQGAARRVARSHLWTVIAGAALVNAAWWLRNPGIRYLAASLIATGIAVVLTLGLAPRARQWGAAAVAAAVLWGALALMAQRRLDRIDRAWPAYRAELVARGNAAFARALGATTRALRAIATRAADAPADPPRAFTALARTVRGHAERGVVLYRRGEPAAWAGRVYTPTDTLVAPIGVTDSPFYVTLYAVVARGETRAVAAAVVYANPPADRLAAAVGNRIARRIGLHAFDVDGVVPGGGGGGPATGASAASVGVGGFVYAPVHDTLLVVHAVAPGREEARLLALERARLVGVAVMVVALLLYLIAVWRQERGVAWRLVPLAVALGSVALVPLSTFSGVSVLFDPSVYYAELGGPFTANVAALVLAAAIVLLGVLMLLRARGRVLARRVAIAVVVAIMGSGPFLLRGLSRGVSPPPGGVTDQLWLAWEIALFLAAAALLVLAATAGSTLLGRGRGLPLLVAPALAGLAAFLGPILLDPPGAWPQWYTLFWIAAIGALALTRPHRGLLFSAATVAALGATTLTWNAGVRGRTALADRDVAGLADTPPDVVAVLERFADIIAEEAPPRTQADLVQRYMESDLVGAGYPVALQSWAPGEASPMAQVALDPITIPAPAIASAVAEADGTQQRVLRSVRGTPGVLTVLAVPFRDGTTTTVIVAPRTRLIPNDPFNALLGLEGRETGQPPYSITLVDLDPTTPTPEGETRWYRSGTELHGDRLVQTAQGPQRAHIEIELRSQASLVQRGVLVVLVDLLVVVVLWVVSVFPGGAFRRWLRTRARRWVRSYRARLTVGLFGFFVVPALVFAFWSYQRLRSEDEQSRELLVRETLRSAAAAGTIATSDVGGAHAGTPLFVYRHGALRQTSEPLLDALAPVGRFLPRAVYARLREGHEVYSTAHAAVGPTDALFGYLSTVAPAPGGLGSGEPVVFAAPARGHEEMLDQRRRDLGVLVLFATVLGGLAALWLSRIASRSLAEPIGRLRAAALAIAAGEREPPLAGRPPEEFDPVFSAFRRMAADLGASRAALEAAQRRTSAVLRNVASGVVALGHEGTVTIANPRAEALLGRALPPGAPVDELGAAIAARVRAFVAQRDDEEEFELTLGGRQLQARLTRLADGDGGAVLTLDDVTELARAQRVLAWGEMARQVAHEIKNPLTPIRLGVQHLKRARADARADFDEILDRNARHILAEIDRLDEIARNFSRYGTAPAEQLPAQPVDVVAVARGVVELERLGRSDVDWRVAGGEHPLLAMARRDELHEVLLNLLENARLADATRVEIRCAAREGRVVLEVADDGRGIAPAVLPRIFEPHFSTRTSGSGLGLAVSRQLVESWGGSIAIASTDATGTTVRIELRAVSPAPDGSAGGAGEGGGGRDA